MNERTIKIVIETPKRRRLFINAKWFILNAQNEVGASEGSSLVNWYLKT